MVRTIYICLFCLPFFFACELKKDLFGSGKDSEKEVSYENAGLLDLELKAEKEAETPAKKGSTRSQDDLSPDEFEVSVLDSLGEVIRKYDSYAQMRSATDLLLPAGSYVIKAAKGNNPNAGFDSPYYAGDTTCTISAKEVSKVMTSCKLQNKKVQFGCSNDFFQKFKGDYSIVVDNGVGVVVIAPDDSRIPYLKNTGALRFTIYATTVDNKPCTYSYDLSEESQLQGHNNIYIGLDALEARPDTPTDPGDPNNPGDEDPEQPETPQYPVSLPTIKVDVSLIEKDYIIEIPSDFVDSNRPGQPGDGEEPEEPQPSTDPAITGMIDGQAFNLSSVQTISANTKSVVINMYLPTGLDALKVTVNINALGMSLPLDLLNENDGNYIQVKELLQGMGKELIVPSKGSKGSLVFDISPFLDLLVGLGGDASFVVSLGDANGKSDSKTVKLIMK